MPCMISRLQVLTQLDLAFGALVFHGSVAAGAATAGPSAANPTEITVDLTPHDKKGNIVPDLRPFTDGGIPVSLKRLRLAGQVSETITFVYDQVVPGVAKTDCELAEEFLTAVSGRGNRFPVLKVGGRLHLVQAPTSDVEAVKDAIAAATLANRPEYLKVTEAAEKQPVHFALGPDERAESVEITWPSRSAQILRDVEGDRTLKVKEPAR